MTEYEFAANASCRHFSWNDRPTLGSGACLRVNEVFNRLSEVGARDDKPDDPSECLIFAALAGNMRRNGTRLPMGEHDRKHVGILGSGQIRHYSVMHYRSGCTLSEDPTGNFRECDIATWSWPEREGVSASRRFTLDADRWELVPESLICL